MLMVMLGMFTAVSMFAQPAGFQQHGNNSSGTTVASENIDSITVGASVRYVVEPDATANPSYTFSTMSGTLSSTFQWDVTNVSTTNGTLGDTDNDVTITAAAAATTGTIEVVESSSSGCGSGTTTTIDIAVIDDPEADLGNTTFDNDSAVCIDAAANVALDVPITLATEVTGGSIRIHVNIDGPATSDIYDADIDLNESATDFTLAAGTFNDGFGDYSIQITNVSDRISRKCSVTNGTITTGTYTLTINRTPTTGNIYHLPNN